MVLKNSGWQFLKNSAAQRLIGGLFFLLVNTAYAQSVVINEVSQGTVGSQEYVEFLVTGPDLVNCDDTPPCLDLRNYIFDDNNGFLNGGPTSGVGIASGACRFSNNAMWACIPVGTVIVVYNDADVNSGIPAQDLSMSDANCKLVIPVSSTLFERHNTLPSTSNGTYATTGWISGGSWTPISMANAADGFQIYAPSNTITPVFSVGWGSGNSLGTIYMGTSTAAGKVFYANDCNYFAQASWVNGTASSAQTAGSFNQSQACAGQMNANCDPPTINITPIAETCSGDCDGGATVTVSGGTSSFQYVWSPAPTSGQGTNSPDGFCPGNITLTFTDDNGNGCILTENVTINNGVTCCAMTNTQAFTNATCAGANDGTITLTETAGIFPVTFSIDGGTTTQSNGNFAGLSPGSYNVLIEDGLGCQYTSVIVIADGAAPVTPMFTAVAPICAGDILTPLSTTSTNGISGTWSPALNNTATTTYTFTPAVSACAVSTLLSITVNPVVTPTFAAVAPICVGDALAALPTTSTNSVTGSWSPALNNAATTTYTFTPTGQCELDANLTITVNPIYTISENYTVCEGTDFTYPDGTVSTNLMATETHVSSFTTIAGCDSVIATLVTVINITTTTLNADICSGDNYTFADGVTHTNITANESYTATLTSVAGCDSIITTTITVYPVYSFVQNTAVCQNETFIFPDGSSQLITANTSHVSALTSVNGCDSLITTMVTMIPTYTLSENVTTCQNSNYTFPDGTNQLITTSVTHLSNLTSLTGCDSIITTNVTMIPVYNGTQNVTICEGSDFTFPDGTTHTNITVSENYVSLFTGVGGCDSSITTSIQVQLLPTVSAGADQVVCDGTLVTLNASGAVLYSWEDGVANGIPFTPIAAVWTYTVTGTDNLGCSNTDQIQVNVSPAIVPDFLANVTSGCAPLEVIFTNQTTGSANCIWDFGDGSTTSDCGDPSYIFDNSGVYDITLTVTDLTGCTYTSTLSNYIAVTETPQASFFTDQTTISELDNEVVFINNSTGGETYAWYFGDGSPTDLNENTGHIYSASIENASYTVTLVVNNSGGCSDTAHVQLITEEAILFYVPNAFTPDGDAFNEKFQPVFTSGFDPYDYHLSIFNRWGELVFESYNAAIGWDGTYADNGLASDEVYVWKIEFKEMGSDRRQEHSGHVTILK